VNCRNGKINLREAGLIPGATMQVIIVGQSKEAISRRSNSSYKRERERERESECHHWRVNAIGGPIQND
jgi:hypothetical protein